MSATAMLLTLLLAPAGGAAAPAEPAPTCQSFSRDAHGLPPLVRAWFASSQDERVLVCAQPLAPGGGAPTALYYGEGAVSQRGAVCSYLSHGLTLTGSGDAARLQRYEHTEALDMALAGVDCPPPHGATGAAAYVETYDITPAAFVGIMRLWSAATISLASGGNVAGCCAARGSTTASAPAAGQPAAAAGATEPRIAPAARAGLEAALPAPRARAAAVTRIVRIPGSVLRRRYALFLTVPASPSAASALYLVYVDKSLRGPYEITAFAESN